MSPHPTGEHPLAITETSRLQTDWKTLGLVIGAVILGTLGYADLKSTQREQGAVVNTTENRVGRLEEAKASTDLHIQHIDDTLERMDTTLNRIDRKLDHDPKGH